MQIWPKFKGKGSLKVYRAYRDDRFMGEVLGVDIYDATKAARKKWGSSAGVVVGAPAGNKLYKG